MANLQHAVDEVSNALAVDDRPRVRAGIESLRRREHSASSKRVAFLGLITACFVVAAIMLEPSWKEVAWGAIPSLPGHDKAQYWFIAVGILGASISPYLMLFYSAGAMEDKWDESYITTNRIIAGLGMRFGGGIAERTRLVR